MNHEFEVRCVDNLDAYLYILLHDEKTVLSREEADLFRYAVVTSRSGRYSMLLRESHADANNLKDPQDPHTHIVTINHIEL